MEEFEFPSFFTSEEQSIIKSNTVDFKSGTGSDAVQLGVAWASHVDKLDKDRLLPYSDRTVWTEFDLCAALIIRDYLQRAIEILPGEVARKVATYFSPADDQFRSMTVDDSGKRMEAIAGFSLEGRGWWWFRVPDSGPILQDLARWDKFEQA